MAQVTRDEIIKIARMSYLDIHEDEIEQMVQQVDQVLNYAERVQEVASKIEEQDFESANVNVFREDEIIPTDPKPILDQAPEKEGTYFVVPRILETNE